MRHKPQYWRPLLDKRVNQPSSNKRSNTDTLWPEPVLHLHLVRLCSGSGDQDT